MGVTPEDVKRIQAEERQRIARLLSILGLCDHCWGDIQDVLDRLGQ